MIVETIKKYLKLLLLILETWSNVISFISSLFHVWMIKLGFMISGQWGCNKWSPSPKRGCLHQNSLQISRSSTYQTAQFIRKCDNLVMSKPNFSKSRRSICFCGSSYWNCCIETPIVLQFDSLTSSFLYHDILSIWRHNFLYDVRKFQWRNFSCRNPQFSRVGHHEFLCDSYEFWGKFFHCKSNQFSI